MTEIFSNSARKYCQTISKIVKEIIFPGSENDQFRKVRPAQDDFRYELSSLGYIYYACIINSS